jgi:hypothetical protein
VPIQKVEKSLNFGDIRPIKMLPVVGKILEIVVKTQLSQYIENNNILIPQQSGFLRNHFYETSLSMVLKQWKELVEGNKVKGLFSLI